MVTIKFDQVGLSAGVEDKSRSDGLATGAEVTVTTSEPGTVELLWAPIEDYGSAATTLHQVSSTVWKFSPNTDVYGTYRVKFTSAADPSLVTVRLFSIITPVLGLRIPALNEKANPNASLVNSGSDMVADSECNETEESGPFTQGNYGGWYSSMAKLYLAVEALGSAGGTVQTITSTTTAGLTVASPAGPDTQLTLHFGSGAGQIAAGAGLATAQADIDAAESDIASLWTNVTALLATTSSHTTSINSLNTTVSGHTTSINSHTSSIASLSSSLSSHTGDTNNPHAVTKTQVGLSAVTNDAQLKRAGSDWSGFSTVVPASGDWLLSEAVSGGAKGKFSLSAVISVVQAALRDPFWDPPTTASPDDEEFTIDVLASGAWGIVFDGGSTPLTRDGAVDPTVTPASGHYRSSCVGSTLFVQLRQNESVHMFKTLSGALSGHYYWKFGGGAPVEPGTANANNPQFRLQMSRNSGGFPDNGNRALIRMGSSADRIESLTIVGNSTTSTVATSTYPIPPTAVDGIVARANHGSSAAGNWQGIGWKRNGSHALLPATQQSVQFNSATDKIGILMFSNAQNGGLGGSSGTVFALHFLRRIDVTNPYGFAQA